VKAHTDTKAMHDAFATAWTTFQPVYLAWLAKHEAAIAGLKDAKVEIITPPELPGIAQYDANGILTGYGPPEGATDAEKIQNGLAWTKEHEKPNIDKRLNGDANTPGTLKSEMKFVKNWQARFKHGTEQYQALGAWLQLLDANEGGEQPGELQILPLQETMLQRRIDLLEAETKTPRADTPELHADFQTAWLALQKEYVPWLLRKAAVLNRVADAVQGGNGLDLNQLKQFQKWWEQQVNETLNRIENRSGLDRTPWRGTTDELNNIIGAEFARIDARAQLAPERESVHNLDQAAHEAYFGKFDKAGKLVTKGLVQLAQDYNTMLAQLGQQLSGDIDGRTDLPGPQKTELKDQLTRHLLELQRAPPPVFRVGDTYYKVDKDSPTPKPFYTFGSEPLTTESVMRIVMNASGQMLDKQAAVQNLPGPFGDASKLDLYFGSVRANVHGAPFHDYMLVAVRLDPEQRKWLAQHIMGIERRTAFLQQFNREKGRPIGHAETDYTFLAIDSVAYKNGQFEFAVAGFMQVGLTKDSQVGEVSGVLGYDVSKRSHVKLTFAEGRGRQQYDYRAILQDPLTDDVIATDVYRFKDVDAFSKQSIEWELQANDDMSFSFGFTREALRTNGLWPDKTATFGTIGFRAGGLSVEKAIGADRMKLGYRTQLGKLNLSGSWQHIGRTDTVALGGEMKAGNGNLSFEARTSPHGGKPELAIQYGDQRGDRFGASGRGFDGFLKVGGRGGKEKPRKPVELVPVSEGLTDVDRWVMTPVTQRGVTPVRTETQTEGVRTDLPTAFLSMRTLAGEQFFAGTDLLNLRIRGKSIDPQDAGSGFGVVTPLSIEGEVTPRVSIRDNLDRTHVANLMTKAQRDSQHIETRQAPGPRRSYYLGPQFDKVFLDDPAAAQHFVNIEGRWYYQDPAGQPHFLFEDGVALYTFAGRVPLNYVIDPRGQTHAFYRGGEVLILPTPTGPAIVEPGLRGLQIERERLAGFGSLMAGSETPDLADDVSLKLSADEFKRLMTGEIDPATHQPYGTLIAEPVRDEAGNYVILVENGHVVIDPSTGKPATAMIYRVENFHRGGKTYSGIIVPGKQGEEWMRTAAIMPRRVVRPVSDASAPGGVRLEMTEFDAPEGAVSHGKIYAQRQIPAPGNGVSPSFFI